MICEMCGSEKDLVRGIIEDTELIVCKNCARFGKILGPIRNETGETLTKAKNNQAKSYKEESTEMIVKDFPNIIRKKRESLCLNQEDFAKTINEKLSFVHKMESGELVPTIETAKKLEKMLGLKLVEEYAAETFKPVSESSKGFTIGDIIKIKKR